MPVFPSPPPADETLQRLKAIVGEKGFSTDAGILAPFLADQRGHYHARAAALLRPQSTAEVAQIVALCRSANLALVPQGGNTGLVGGGLPDETGHAVVLNLSRMNRIRSLDAEGYSLTAEAGCVLAAVQKAALEADRYFPLRMASEGSCQIGGVIATNAGGVNVLRYGTARALTLGLEVVLPDGQVLDLLGGLRKDNTGYDTKQLFIGAEGTLGVITAATLKIFPLPQARATALLALNSPQDALAVFTRAESSSNGALNACEILPRRGLEFVLTHISGSRDPFERAHPWYLLIEAESAQPGKKGGEVLQSAFEEMLSHAMEENLVTDAVLAKNEREADALWRLRESLPEAQKHEGASLKHDVAVAVAKVPLFLEQATRLAETALPGVRVVAFGHLGDGNIHFNLSVPPGMKGEDFLAQRDALSRRVYDLVGEMGGSISAEHGIGRLKIEDLRRTAPKAELDIMRAIKRLIDPANIMNPGKVITPED